MMDTDERAEIKLCITHKTSSPLSITLGWKKKLFLIETYHSNTVHRILSLFQVEGCM